MLRKQDREDPLSDSFSVPISLLPPGTANEVFYHLHFVSILHTLYFPHSCGLERLFSFPAQPPFPPEAVTPLLLGAGVVVGKLECPRRCQAAGLPRQPPPACQCKWELLESICPFCFHRQVSEVNHTHHFKALNTSVFRSCYTELPARMLCNIYLCFLFRKSVTVLFPSHIWKAKQSMVWLQTLQTLPPLKAACVR